MFKCVRILSSFYLSLKPLSQGRKFVFEWRQLQMLKCAAWITSFPLPRIDNMIQIVLIQSHNNTDERMDDLTMRNETTEDIEILFMHAPWLIHQTERYEKFLQKIEVTMKSEQNMNIISDIIGRMSKDWAINCKEWCLNARLLKQLQLKNLYLKPGLKWKKCITRQQIIE